MWAWLHTIDMKAPSCLARHVACLVLVLLYSLIAVLPRSNGDRLFLVISNSSEIAKPTQARYVSSEQMQCGCEITESSALMGLPAAFQERVNTCNERPEDYGIGVCTSVFANFSSGPYNVTLATTNQTDMDQPLTFASRRELCEKMETVRNELLLFQSLLDRTLVCVFTLTCENKTSCLVSLTTLPHHGQEMCTHLVMSLSYIGCLQGVALCYTAPSLYGKRAKRLKFHRQSCEH